MTKGVAVESRAVPVNTGIKEADRRAIADGLGRVLADTFVLYLKTHNFHWNVTGPMFPQLHALFEAQYNELWQATDVLAERIRALGFPAPATLVEFQRLASLAEDEGSPAAETMIQLLVEGNESVIRTARSVFTAAEHGNDEATADLLTQRLAAHEKAAWMLRSMLA